LGGVRSDESPEQVPRLAPERSPDCAGTDAERHRGDSPRHETRVGYRPRTALPPVPFQTGTFVRAPRRKPPRRSSTCSLVRSPRNRPARRFQPLGVRSFPRPHGRKRLKRRAQLLGPLMPERFFAPPGIKDALVLRIVEHGLAKKRLEQEFGLLGAETRNVRIDDDGKGK
jgi:hypothetical protein